MTTNPMTDPCVEAVALLPCPFCGEQLEHVPNEECVSQWFHPLASNCILNGQGIADLTAWNTRIEAITRSEAAEIIEELTEALKEARMKLSGAGYDPIQACNEAERVIEKALQSHGRR